MKTLTEIRRLLDAHRDTLTSRFGVQRIAIFGSYARQEQTPLSDVDIAVELERPLGWEIVDLHDYLEEILHARVDLVTIERSKESLICGHVLKRISFMPERDVRLFLFDMLESIARIERYIDGLDKVTFVANDMALDAVTRNLEIIGEAARQIPETLREQYPLIPWRRVVGLRNIVIHQYFAVDPNII